MSLLTTFGLIILFYVLLVIVLIIHGTKANKKFDAMIDRELRKKSNDELTKMNPQGPVLRKEGWTVYYRSEGIKKKALFKLYPDAVAFLKNQKDRIIW